MSVKPTTADTLDDLFAQAEANVRQGEEAAVNAIDGHLPHVQQMVGNASDASVAGLNVLAKAGVAAAATNSSPFAAPFIVPIAHGSMDGAQGSVQRVTRDFSDSSTQAGAEVAKQAIHLSADGSVKVGKPLVDRSKQFIADKS